jgi:hypothetical protein
MLHYGFLFILIVVSVPKAENLIINLKIQGKRALQHQKSKKSKPNSTSVTPDDKHTSKVLAENTTVVLEPVVDSTVKVIEDPDLVDDACLHTICGKNCFERPHCHKFNETIVSIPFCSPKLSNSNVPYTLHSL